MLHRKSITPKNPTEYMVAYYAKHGVWPIVGGSDIATAGQGGQQDPGTQPPVAQPPSTDPQQPVSTDPASGFPDATNVRSLPPRDPETGQFVSEEEMKARIEKARQEEKDKVYGRIEGQQTKISEMEEQLRVMREEREARLAAEEEAKKAQEEEARLAAEEEMSVRELLAKKEQEWNERFMQINAEREAERALIQKERQLQEVMDYRRQAVEAAEDDIIPELRDLVAGNTPEEIDASIAVLRDRSARIIEQASQNAVAQRAGMKGASVTAPPVGPIDTHSDSIQSFTAEDIAGMDMATYMKNRDRLLGALSNQTREQGLYR